MLLFDRESWARHRPLAFVCLGITLLASAGYAVECIRAGKLLGGSSLSGLACGSLAGLLILYECSFVLRGWKAPYAPWLRNPAPVRLRRHIWFGLLTVPLVIIHSGLFTRGSPLVLVLLGLFGFVIISGVWGLIVQNWLPSRLLVELPDETVASQIPALADQLCREAELLVLATCGPDPEASDPSDELRRNIAILRAHREGKGTGLLALMPPAPIPRTESLRRYFTQSIAPYLRQGAETGSPLRIRERAIEDFVALRNRVAPASHGIVDALEVLCDRRRQFDRQADIHGWLHGWLRVHLPFSVVLALLLIWHAVTAVIYW